jgi:hypothetical protein
MRVPSRGCSSGVAPSARHSAPSAMASARAGMSAASHTTPTRRPAAVHTGPRPAPRSIRAAVASTSTSPERSSVSRSAAHDAEDSASVSPSSQRTGTPRCASGSAAHRGRPGTSSARSRNPASWRARIVRTAMGTPAIGVAACGLLPRTTARWTASLRPSFIVRYREARGGPSRLGPLPRASARAGGAARGAPGGWGPARSGRRRVRKTGAPPSRPTEWRAVTGRARTPRARPRR